MPSDLHRPLTTRASLLSCPARCSPPPPCPAAFLPHWTDFPLPTVPILSPSCPSLLSPPHPGAGSLLYDPSLAILTQHIGLCSSREPRPSVAIESRKQARGVQGGGYQRPNIKEHFCPVPWHPTHLPASRPRPPLPSPASSSISSSSSMSRPS